MIEITLLLFLALGFTLGLLWASARPHTPEPPPIDAELVAVTEDGRELEVSTTGWKIADGRLSLVGMVAPVDKTAVILGLLMVSGTYRRALDPLPSRIHLWPGDSVEVKADLWFTARPDGKINMSVID